VNEGRVGDIIAICLMLAIFVGLPVAAGFPLMVPLAFVGAAVVVAIPIVVLKRFLFGDKVSAAEESAATDATEVPGPAAGSARVGEQVLPLGQPRRAMDAGRNQADGRLPGRRLRDDDTAQANYVMPAVIFFAVLGGIFALAALASGPSLMGLLAAGAFIWGAIKLHKDAKTADAATATVKAMRRVRFAEYGPVGFKVKQSFHGEVVCGIHAGRAFEHYVIPPKKDQPPRTVVSISTATPGDFVVCRETTATEFAKGIHLVDEFQTGDAAFDEEYYCSGSTEDYVRAVFGNAQNLQRLRNIVAAGFDRVEKDGRKLSASAEGRREYFSVDRIKKIVEGLTSLQLPREVAGSKTRFLTGKQPLILARAVAAVIAFVGIYGAYASARPLGDFSEFVRHVAPAVILALAVLLAAMYFVLKGHSMAMPGIVEIGFYVPVAGIALVGVAMLANEHLDSSKPQMHQVRVQRVYATHGSKGAVYHHVWFESWRGRDHEHLQVDGDIYALAQTSVGKPWQLRVHDGWLGVPWVSSMQLAQ
jgi:hypothetical protein